MVSLRLPAKGQQNTAYIFQVTWLDDSDLVQMIRELVEALRIGKIGYNRIG
jgi:hypothetical protein